MYTSKLQLQDSCDTQFTKLKELGQPEGGFALQELAVLLGWPGKLSIMLIITAFQKISTKA